MPTYEYECLACEETFERFQGISEPPVRACPACGKRRVRRKIGGGAALLFKGSGFYVTDYRGSDYASKAESDGGSPKPSGEVKKTETKEKKASA